MTHISPDASRAAPGRTQSLTSPPGAFLFTYLAVWASTLAAAALTAAAGSSVKRTVRRVLALTLTPANNPPPTAAHILALAAHNLPVAAWPLLLGCAGTASNRRGKRAADSLLVACALANTIPVGAAIGAYGISLIPYIPQLPVEWAALAAGYGSWITQRKRPIRRRERLERLAATALLVLAAATIETVAVPHRKAADSSSTRTLLRVHKASRHIRRLQPNATSVAQAPRENVARKIQTVNKRAWYFTSAPRNSGCRRPVCFAHQRSL